MNCKNCGVINEEDALYCKKCGCLLRENHVKKKKEFKTRKQKVKRKTKTKTKIKRIKQNSKDRNNQKNSFGKNLLIFFLIILIMSLLSISFVMGYHIYNEEKNIEVPNLYHLSYEKAQLILAKKNLKILKKEKKISKEEENNIVINQNKKAGTKVSKNTIIKVTIGKYDFRYIVEDFMGKNIDEVKNNLDYYNISYQIVKKKIQNEEENNIVISQNPKAGTKMSPHTKIEIVIGEYQKPEIKKDDEFNSDDLIEQNDEEQEVQ